VAKERDGPGAVDLEHEVDRLRQELEQVQAWCEGLETRLAEVLALLRLLGIWEGPR
jgi:hypothetical protein